MGFRRTLRRRHVTHGRSDLPVKESFFQLVGFALNIGNAVIHFHQSIPRGSGEAVFRHTKPISQLLISYENPSALNQVSRCYTAVENPPNPDRVLGPGVILSVLPNTALWGTSMPPPTSMQQKAVAQNNNWTARKRNTVSHP